jgi:hypothetical protein
VFLIFYLFNFNVDINRAEQTAGQGDINPEPSLDQSPFPGFLSLSLSFFIISLNYCHGFCSIFMILGSFSFFFSESRMFCEI